MTSNNIMQKLLDIMVALRDPKTGCAWDVAQTFETVAPYTVEEAYEVVDAITRKDFMDLKDELGDLLLQVVFHARIAEEKDLFSFSDVVEAVCRKMLRRHPHVFGNPPIKVENLSAEWERIKAEEKQERLKAREVPSLKGVQQQNESFLDDVPVALPALLKAEKLTKKAAQVGFDWPDTEQVIEKIEEELDEVREAMESQDKDLIAEEIGDLLFAVTNLARHIKVSPETALQKTNDKFKRRFAYIEKSLQDKGKSLKNTHLDEMEAFWVEAKERGL